MDVWPNLETSDPNEQDIAYLSLTSEVESGLLNLIGFLFSLKIVRVKSWFGYSFIIRDPIWMLDPFWKLQILLTEQYNINLNLTSEVEGDLHNLIKFLFSLKIVRTKTWFGYSSIIHDLIWMFYPILETSDPNEQDNTYVNLTSEAGSVLHKLIKFLFLREYCQLKNLIRL